MIIDLINHSYGMEPPQKTELQGSESSQVGEHMEGGLPGEGMEGPSPFPHALPYVSPPFGCSQVVSFKINW